MSTSKSNTNESTNESTPAFSLTPKLSTSKEGVKTIRIVLVLDESGSMEPNRKEIIQTVNKFIKEQQELVAENECLLTLIKFNDTCSAIIDDQPIKNIKPISLEQYKPDGMTSLYDAIGQVFVNFSENNNVILVIMTDGLENSSKLYKQSQIKTFINKYTDPKTFAWNIIYLSADPMLSTQGENIGVSSDPTRGTSNVSTNFEQLDQYYRTTLTRAISNYRTGLSRNVTL